MESERSVAVKAKVTIKDNSDERKIVPEKVYQDDTVELSEGRPPELQAFHIETSYYL